MNKIKYILFDCMETLIDLTQLPEQRDYAKWSFEGSGVEKFWTGFEEYFRLYQQAKSEIEDGLSEHEEYEMFDRFYPIARLQCGENANHVISGLSHSLYHCFWHTYLSKCYLKEDVKEMVPKLAEGFKLGVVSNFMVKNGIEELLTVHGLIKHFDFVVTSVNEGWRKPHPKIFAAAINLAGVSPEECIFIGDDYVNDFIGAANAGFKVVFLDRFDRHPEIGSRIRDFYKIRQFI
jgi:putative hydrolase of the HAD superfamily